VATGKLGAVGPAALVGGVGGGGGGGVALATVVRPRAAPYAAPLSAVLEGLLLGGASALDSARFAGLPLQAVSLTFGVFAAPLLAYRAGLARATENFPLGGVAAAGGIAATYLPSVVLRRFGVRMAVLHDSSPLSIGISLAVVVVAALNLVLDFDVVERGGRHGAPRHMEAHGVVRGVRATRDARVAVPRNAAPARRAPRPRPRLSGRSPAARRSTPRSEQGSRRARGPESMPRRRL